MTLVQQIIKNSLKSFKYDDTRIEGAFVNKKGSWQDQFLAHVMPKCEMIEMPVNHQGDRIKFDGEGNEIGPMAEAKYIWNQLQWLFEHDEECKKYINS